MSGRSRTRLPAFDARRIALIKPSALGDVVHSLPVLTALRRRFPQAHITWIVNRAFEPLLQGHRDLDETLPFDRGVMSGNFWRATRTAFTFCRELRRRRFDLVVDLQCLLRSGLMTAATGARYRIGLGSAREGAKHFYTHTVGVADLDTLHAVDRYWEVALALGVGDTVKEFHVPVTDAAKQWADEMLQALPRPWLMLGVGSRWVTKRWLPEHFAGLAQQAQTHFGGTAVFLGGGDEAPLAEEVRARLAGPALNLSGRTTIPQLAAALARADVMIANDTGPLHLAAALGRPVVAPYTCTKVRLTGPYQSPRTAVESRVWCQGSYVKRCPRMECMAELTPDRLWPVLREVLQSWESRSPKSAGKCA
jgi:lipopolysaccharide heptosyltransferase I